MPIMMANSREMQKKKMSNHQTMNEKEEMEMNLIMGILLTQ